MLSHPINKNNKKRTKNIFRSHIISHAMSCHFILPTHRIKGYTRSKGHSVSGIRRHPTWPGWWEELCDRFRFCGRGRCSDRPRSYRTEVPACHIPFHRLTKVTWTPDDSWSSPNAPTGCGCTWARTPNSWPRLSRFGRPGRGILCYDNNNIRERMVYRRAGSRM